MSSITMSSRPVRSEKLKVIVSQKTKKLKNCKITNERVKQEQIWVGQQALPSVRA